MTSYEEKLGKMEEDEISGEKILTDRQVEMLQAEDERNYYSSRDENPYRQYQKVTNRLKKFKKKQVKTYIATVKSKMHGHLHQNDIRLNWGASFRWSFGPLSAWGTIESTTILTTHPSLPGSFGLK